MKPSEMSLPPEIIRVKRKRGDETTPVTFLELESGTKRHCSGSNRWVYQRRGPAQVHSSIPAPAPAPVPAPAYLPLPKLAGEEKRRFFLSGVTEPSTKKRRHESAVFVERVSKKPRPEETTADSGSGLGDGFGSATEPTDAGQVQLPLASAPDKERKFKRPSRISRQAKPPSSSSAQRTGPTALPDRASFGDDYRAFVAEMERWSLNEIGRSVTEWEQRSSANSHSAPVAAPPQGSQQTSSRSTSSMKFKPKVPAQRYSERHPASIPETPARNSSARVSPSPEGDGDWVEEVYDRVPASQLNGATSDVGLIVFEDEKEQEIFYGAEDDSDQEVADDEDDENAEDHYTADYPEDEVDEDDEFDRNPYQYRAGGSSDGEFGDDDDEDEFSYPDDGDSIVMAGDSDAEMLRKIRRNATRQGYAYPD